MDRSMTEFYFTGQDLIEMGITPGPGFGVLLNSLNSSLRDTKDMDEDTAYLILSTVVKEYKDASEAAEKLRIAKMIPMLTRGTAAKVIYNIVPQSEEEVANVDSVRSTMEQLVLTPTVVAAAVMPDACPAGSIPVGAVAGAKNAIHPGWHSADICCSMFATNFGSVDPKTILDAVHSITHFGPGGRIRNKEVPMPEELIAALNSGNPFFADRRLQDRARSHLMTQGDGNHFAFVGKSDKTGDTWLVTHHGSRGFGALLYKKGMEVAEKFRKELCPELDKGNAFIPYDTDEGRDYWDALQVVREWTKANHSLLHGAVSKATGSDILHQRWNEHNFVFKDGDIFWHAKGATPIHNDYLPDTDGVQIVPLNMSQPILFVKGIRHEGNLGFAPHGAGRNYSRTQHKRIMAGETDADIFARETKGIDARFWCGTIDISELPSAYKDADQVQAQMDQFDLATVVDRIQPYGAIMAGDLEKDAPWRNKK
jgi:tRNA-splicing ligase RtcB (3'-phosphate/5'-hydroxy nucleic acid ligase)